MTTVAEENAKKADELVQSLREIGYGVLLFKHDASLSILDRDMLNEIMDNVFPAGMERRYHPVCDYRGTDRRDNLHEALMNYITAVREGQR